ncbi:Metallo-hydrolase/oxidoreductase [Eremomyces bilateralis CBS 781.70]|uniref:Metallo-hydrolase/oxidoreductase n=1 Tax=Eremomyces bilateralis CBS 781.70 TaxID=1392243 RepID=A0A6G1G378_9PEZI|nr:Metallo-hydrolase/oxidoreductase [Eremomyces bilateralis CBS 781.70]KAF1812567.1 Metallo-hydrolase/oxidoreductase [Eremomyces bilateralis CBS 781.70]
MVEKQTIEWFGATTFRLRAKGLTIFLDTWLERPSNIPTYASIDDIDECDYIFISHAHFDHLPGADRLAKKTGATIVGNGEAVSVMRAAGVPEEQLLPVAGGERIPLFSKSIRDEVRSQFREFPRSRGPPGPPRPDVSKASLSVHVYPSLHCLMPGPPGQHLDFIDTATEYIGGSDPYAGTIDITMGMRYGLLAAAKAPLSARAQMPPDFRPFVEYIADERNKFSNFDGGQMMYNFFLGEKTLLYMSHLGGYSGILKELEPQPDILVMGIAGRGNINGRPFDGSAAQCATNIIKWLGEPEKIIWCLHDKAPIKPFRVETEAAAKMVEAETRSRVLTLEHATVYDL